jgi:hypothetical protein
MACYLVYVATGYVAVECEHCKERLQLKLPNKSKPLGHLLISFEDWHKDCCPSETT